MRTGHRAQRNCGHGGQKAAKNRRSCVFFIEGKKTQTKCIRITRNTTAARVKSSAWHIYLALSSHCTFSRNALAAQNRNCSRIIFNPQCNQSGRVDRVDVTIGAKWETGRAHRSVVVGLQTHSSALILPHQPKVGATNVNNNSMQITRATSNTQKHRNRIQI